MYSYGTVKLKLFNSLFLSKSSVLPVCFSSLILTITLMASLQMRFKFAVPYITSIILFFTIIIAIMNFIQIVQDVLVSSKIYFWVKVAILSNIAIYFFVATELTFVRMSERYKGILWQVDWRHALGHSYSFSRYPSNSNSLAYDGYEVNYHAAASLLAGHFMKVFCIDAFYVLFLVIPIFTLISVLLFARTLGRFFNLDPMLAYVLSMIAITIPVFQIKFFSTGEFRNLFTNVAFDNEVMINSYLAIAVCFSALILFFSTNDLAVRLLSSTIPMFALMSLKPQFIPILGIVVYVLNSRFTITEFTVTLRVNLVVLSSALLALALAFLKKSSGHLSFEFSVNAYNMYARQGFALPALTFLSFASAIIVFTMQRKAQISRTIKWIVNLICCYFFIRTISAFVIFRNPSIERLPSSIAGNIKSSGVDLDLEQGFVLLNFVLVFTLLIQCAFYFQHKKFLLSILVFFLIAINSYKFLNYAEQFSKPLTRGFEAIDNRELDSLLGKLESDSLLLVNDIADPTMDFNYSGRGNYLLVNDRVKFYFANLWPEWQAPDFTYRYSRVKRFFGTPVSSFHEEFLHNSGVTHILLSKRCLPPWGIEPEKAEITSNFYLFEASEIYRLLDIRHDAHNVAEKSYGQLKIFGRADCL